MQSEEQPEAQVKAEAKSATTCARTSSSDTVELHSPHSKMNWWQRLSAIGEFIGGVGTIVLVIGLLVQIEDAAREFEDYKFQRRTERMDKLSAQFNDQTMLYYRAAALSQEAGSPELIEVLSFFERMAREHQHGVITTDDIWYYFNDAVWLYWCACEEWIKQNRIAAREDPNTGELWSGLQQLATALSKEKGEKCLGPKDLEYQLGLEVERYHRLTMKNALKEVAVSQ